MNPRLVRSALLAIAMLTTVIPSAAAENEPGFVEMFNGRDLTGWQTSGNWVVEEGNIITLKPREGESGWKRFDDYLTTKRKYGDFILDLEFKFDQGGNSGVFMRIGDLKDHVNSGFEVQILDTHGKKKLGHHDCGGLIKTQAPSKNMVKPAGEWNRYTITLKGSHLHVVLNGEAIIDLDLSQSAMKDRPATGHISFQDEAKRIWYRNVRIKELNRAASKKQFPISPIGVITSKPLAAAAKPTQVSVAPTSIEISATEVRLNAGPMRRHLRMEGGNVWTDSLRVADQELLAGAAPELTLTVSRAEPNARPRGLKPGEGGVINSPKTFRPGHRVDPATYDDSSFGPTTRWVDPVRIEARRWSDLMVLAGPELTTPAPGAERLALAARGRTGGALEGLTITLHYEVYDGEPVVRKWVAVANQSQYWRKLDHLTLDDFSLASGFTNRTPLTPAGYGAEPSLIGYASADRTLGVIAASEIPSALRSMGDHGAQGYHAGMFEWVLAPGEEFISEPVFLYAFHGPVEPTASAVSVPLDRAVEGPFQRFLQHRLGLVGYQFPCDAPQWLSWASFQWRLNDALMREMAHRAAQAGFVQFLMDDGWQRDRLGTEPDAAKFPDFAATLAHIRSLGLKPGLWVSCFRDTNSPDWKAHAAAVARPTVTRLGGVAMSFTTPWREFYARDLARLHERYGVVYVKQDFSNPIYGDLAEDHPSRTRKESLLRGLRGLLESQDRLRALAPGVMNELTHEIYWDTPGVPCDLAVLKHAARYHIPPNAIGGLATKYHSGASPAVTAEQVATLQREFRASCFQAREAFYAHRGLPLFPLEFYGAATESAGGSLSPEIQDRQVVSWLLGAPLVFSGDLRTLSPEQLAHYRQRFDQVNRLHKHWGIYRHFQFSGVPPPTDEDWHWWGKLNDDGHGAVVVVRGGGGADRRAINVPWVQADRRYQVTAAFSGRNLGVLTGRQLRNAALELALPANGQEILELTPPE